MQFDWNFLNQGGQLDKVLSTLPYPLEKDDVVAQAQRAGATPQIVDAIKQVLPDETFESAEDIKKIIQGGGRH